MGRIRQAGRKAIATLPLLGLLAALSVDAHELPYTDIRFDRLNVEDGLSNGSVNAIFQDRAGLMWFGTEDGLNRYDGREFVTWQHDPADPGSLSSSNITAITLDREGSLWLGTWGGGLNRLDLTNGQITRFDQNLGFEGERVEFVFESSPGDIWVGTETSGLNRYSAGEGRFEHFQVDPSAPDGLASNSIKDIAESADGRLYIGTDDGLYEFHGDRAAFTRLAVPGLSAAGSERIRSLAIDAEGGLWVGTRGDGLKRLDTATGEWWTYRHQDGESGGLSENAVARVFIDSTGMVWVATYSSGLDRLNPATGEFRHFAYTSDPTEEGVSFTRIDAIYEDRGGMLWLGTRGGGINKTPVISRGFRNFRTASDDSHGLPHASVRSLGLQGSDGGDLIWIGTDGGGLARFNSSEGHFATDSIGAGQLGDSRIWAILADREDRLWVGTYSAGLFLIQRPDSGGGVRQFTHEASLPDSLSSERVTTLLEAYDGGLWVGTNSGLNRLRSLSATGARFDRFQHDPADEASISNDHVTAMVQDDGGRIWIGTRRGLNVLEPGSLRFRRYLARQDEPSSLSSDHILSLYMALDGTLWIGTEEAGLNAYDTMTGRFTRIFGPGDRVPSRIASILADESGTLWMGTSRGLARYDPADGSFRVFGASSDVRVLNFLPGAAQATPSGEMYFGGRRGLVSFRPGSVAEIPDPPALIFTGVTRFDTGEDLLGGIPAPSAAVSVDHDAAFLRFDFAAMDYLSPSENRYEHMLEGVDKNWISTGNRGSATYSKLAPGRYVFRARAANGDGVWNLSGILADVRVVPALWQTWWFRAIAVVLLATLAYFAYLLRTRSMRASSLQLAQLNTRLLHQVNERNKAEGEREALIMELEARNAEMERFTYSVSHDLKSPLITIKGFLGLLRQDQQEGKLDRVDTDISRIEAATVRMNQLLDELLALSRAGKGAQATSRVGFGSLVKDALSAAAGEISARGVSVSVQEDMPEVEVDRVRMTEVIQNLVTNAVRFMGDQLHPHIEIGARERGDSTVFFVRDNGIGIEPRHQQKVFELFERLDPATPGTGIGLALVKRIIDLHGGEIWVESQGAGTGSTFCFRLPTARRGRGVSEEVIRAAS